MGKSENSTTDAGGDITGTTAVDAATLRPVAGRLAARSNSVQRTPAFRAMIKQRVQKWNDAHRAQLDAAAKARIEAQHPKSASP